MKTAHKLEVRGRISDPRHWVYFCSCGNWELPQPTVGCYGHTTGRAKFGRVKMAHHMHVRGQVRKAEKTGAAS